MTTKITPRAVDNLPLKHARNEVIATKIRITRKRLQIIPSELTETGFMKAMLYKQRGNAYLKWIKVI